MSDNPAKIKNILICRYSVDPKWSKPFRSLATPALTVKYKMSEIEEWLETNRYICRTRRRNTKTT